MTQQQIDSVTVGLPVTDLAKALDWYRQLLGEREEVNPVPGVQEMRITPSFWLQLFEQDAAERSSIAVRFETDRIEAAHALAARLAMEVGQIETVPDAVRYFECRDPFGNLLSFYELLD